MMNGVRLIQKFYYSAMFTMAISVIQITWRSFRPGFGLLLRMVLGRGSLWVVSGQSAAQTAARPLQPAAEALRLHTALPDMRPGASFIMRR